MLQQTERLVRSRLGPDIKPASYRLSLQDLDYGGLWTYHGSVCIELDILCATDTIALNGKGLEILDTTITCTSDASVKKPTGIQYESSSEQIHLSFATELQAGRWTLVLRFKGQIQDSMDGFYRSKVDPALLSPSGQTEDLFGSHMLVTQFEPCGARHAFPCFDEPELKATFQLDVELPEELQVLSNMPVMSTTPGSRSGLKRTLFEATPVMSTYLAAWVIGKFNYIESFTKRKHHGKYVPVRIYTTPGLECHGTFALEHAVATLDYFAEIFGTDYTLPKCDHVVVPEFISGAMENWGLLVYRPTKILFDPATTDHRVRLKAAYVISHELAHQWFGNLVTMKWWNELWLNEGFATWAGWLAVDHIHPGWNIWTHFGANMIDDVLSIDSLHCTHAIDVQVHNVDDTEGMFDDITYYKGASIIRMVSYMLSMPKFLKGIALYMDQHKFHNVTAMDLFQALSWSSQTDVETFVRPWIKQAGFPIVSISQNSQGPIYTQKLFQRLQKGPVSGNRQITWPLPSSPQTIEHPENSWLLNKAFDGAREEAQWQIWNHDLVSFYHVDRTPAAIRSLLSLQTQGQCSVASKLCLLRDLRALVFACRKPIGDLLLACSAIQIRGNSFVLGEKLKIIGMLESTFCSNKLICSGLQAYMKNLVHEESITLDWTDPKCGNLEQEYQRLCLQALLGSGDAEALRNINTQFKRWTQGSRDSIWPHLQYSVLGYAVATGGVESYLAVKKAYLPSKQIDGKEVLLTAMGRAKEPAQVRDLLEFIMSEDDVALQNIHIAAASLGDNDNSRLLLWNYMKENWDKVFGRLSKNRSVFKLWLELGLSNFSDAAIAEDIGLFFKDKSGLGVERSLKVVQEAIKWKSAFREKYEEETQSWLQKNGFIRQGKL